MSAYLRCSEENSSSSTAAPLSGTSMVAFAAAARTASCAPSSEVGQTCGDRDQGAQDQAQQDGQPLQRRRREPLDAQDDQQVRPAKAMLIGAPSVFDALPPPVQPTATDISDKPMIKISVPVTRGGKNLSSSAKTSAA